MFDRREGGVTATSDWRLQGQEAYLHGISLERSAYEPSPGNDHDHCEFCGAKFMQGKEPETLQQGYRSADHYRWICPQCFEDFLPQFEWRVVGEPSSEKCCKRWSEWAFAIPRIASAR